MNSSPKLPKPTARGPRLAEESSAAFGVQGVPTIFFPASGIVLGGDALSAFYETGRGSMTVRGRAELPPGRTGQQIVVTELPYGVMKGGDGGLIVQIVDGIRHGALEAIVDLYDDSSQEHDIRLVLVLAPETDADAVLDALYEHRSSNEPRSPPDVDRRRPARHAQPARPDRRMGVLPPGAPVQRHPPRATARCRQASRRLTTDDHRLNRWPGLRSPPNYMPR